MGETQPLILVVEDDAAVAVLQRRRLERAGFRVAVATGTDAAMSLLGESSVDLVVMDYRLGATTGLDLHRRMKAAGFELPVIIVSSSMEDSMVIEAIRVGIRDVVVKNTEFLDYLPDAVRGVLRQAQAVPERLQREARSACVLIVEDDSGIAALERRQLERAGYEVLVAATAVEALETVRKGQVSLLVLDLRLQDSVSGLDVYEELRNEGWTLPAILVTAFPDQAVAIRALRAGIRDFVPKTSDFLQYIPVAVDRVVSQVRLERKLVESELRLASIIGTTMDAIVMCDALLRIVLFNRAAEQMFQCAAQDALGQPLERFIPGLNLLAGVEGDAPPAGAMRERGEVDGIRTGGERVPIEVSMSDVVVDGKRLFTVIARDVSERRRIEGELREADRRKDEFLGMLAHELRNPLAAIMSAGEVLRRRVDDAGSQRLTNVIKRQTKALARMVDDLLDVSRVTLGKIQLTREPLVLADMIARATDGVRDAVRNANLQMDLRVDDEPVMLIGDATRLEQVLTNLLNNAIKFTPSGGRVTVRAGREADEAVIRVLDTGQGIEPGLLSRVFDLFVQADTSLDRSKSGLGIGLALVRQIVTLHGGRVTAFSAGPGQGSEFTVRLPATSDVLAPGRDDTPVHVTAERRLRVLVVDDQPDVAESMALVLESMGHEVRVVYDGSTALAMSRSDPPDVMFVDIGMAETNGYELARSVRLEPRLADVRLVALTGYGRDEDRSRAFEAGFDVHLTKPVGHSRVEAVLAALASPSPVRERH